MTLLFIENQVHQIFFDFLESSMKSKSIVFNFINKNCIRLICVTQIIEIIINCF